jgi:hypothetical protein
MDVGCLSANHEIINITIGLLLKIFILLHQNYPLFFFPGVADDCSFLKGHLNFK